MKTNITIQGIIILIVLIFGVFGFYSLAKESNKRNMGCYNYHVQECEECHNQNKSFALCSGICFDPRDIEDTMDTETGGNTVSVCSIHPLEKCEDHVPKHCLTP